jgi:hypothetical protein
MLCPACHGTGHQLDPRLKTRYPRAMRSLFNPGGLTMLIPCRECGGCGIASCCDTAGAGSGGLVPTGPSAATVARLDPGCQYCGRGANQPHGEWCDKPAPGWRSTVVYPDGQAGEV